MKSNFLILLWLAIIGCSCGENHQKKEVSQKELIEVVPHDAEAVDVDLFNATDKEIENAHRILDSLGEPENEPHKPTNSLERAKPFEN